MHKFRILSFVYIVLAPAFVCLHIYVETPKEAKQAFITATDIDNEILELIADDNRKTYFPNNVCCDLYTTAYVDGMWYSATKDIPETIHVAMQIINSFTEYSDDDVRTYIGLTDTVSGVLGQIENSAFMRHIASAFLNGYGKLFNTMYDTDDIFFPYIDTIGNAFENITPDNIIENLETIFGNKAKDKKGLLSILIDVSSMYDTINNGYVSGDSSSSQSSASGDHPGTDVAPSDQDPSEPDEVIGDLVKVIGEFVEVLDGTELAGAAETIVRDICKTAVTDLIEINDAQTNKMHLSIVGKKAGDNFSDDVLDRLASFAAYALYTADEFKDGTEITAEDIAAYLDLDASVYMP